MFPSPKLYSKCLTLLSNILIVLDRLEKLTLILLEPKVISLCHLYRTRPACSSVQSDQALYCWQTNFRFSSLVWTVLEMEGGNLASYGLMSKRAILFQMVQFIYVFDGAIKKCF